MMKQSLPRAAPHLSVLLAEPSWPKHLLLAGRVQFGRLRFAHEGKFWLWQFWPDVAPAPHCPVTGFGVKPLLKQSRRSVHWLTVRAVLAPLQTSLHCAKIAPMLTWEQVGFESGFRPAAMSLTTQLSAVAVN
jgi:hypothetical protein